MNRICVLAVVIALDVLVIAALSALIVRSCQ